MMNDNTVPLVSEAHPSVTALWEDRLPVEPSGVRDSCGWEQVQTGERLLESQQSATLDPDFKFNGIKSVPPPHTRLPMRAVWQQGIGLQRPEDVILSPGLISTLARGEGPSPNSAAGLPSAPTNWARAGVRRA